VGASTKELQQDIFGDFDAAGKLLGLEILNASTLLGKEALAGAQRS
jgi:uncharacterized protein YuzE